MTKTTPPLQSDHAPDYYKPAQGDTAAAVADGYDNNFQTLDTSKADAGATSTALAAKVDKVEGHDLMTSEERAKLTGIEDEANKYILPVATSDTLGGVKAGSNVTIAEDGTISAAAAPYDLPKASAATLGGIKVGHNLSIRPDGTLDAQTGGGGIVAVSPDAGNTLEQRENGLFVPEGTGGSGGNSILVLPYVAPEVDSATGAVTNSEAFVTAWSNILAKYLAAPDSHALYMEVEDDLGGGGKCIIPCTLLSVSADEAADVYYLTGALSVGMPSEGVTLQAGMLAAFAGISCSKQHILEAVLMWRKMTWTPLTGVADGGPVVIDLSGIDTSDQAQVTAVVQQVLPLLLSTVSKQCTFIFPGGGCVHATYVITGTQLLIAATGILDITDAPFSNRVPISYYLLKATVQGGTVQSASFQIKSANVVTEEALAEVRPLLPSLDEQLVPGEFWPDMEGKLRQVYIRTFRGTTGSGKIISSIPRQLKVVRAEVNKDGYIIPQGVVIGQTYNTSLLFNIYIGNDGNTYIVTYESSMENKPYSVTLKYTKA